jgi:hydroxymethylbilane synthase
MAKIKIATRKSQLALWQSEYVAKLLQQQYPDLMIEYVMVSTVGDAVQDRPLAAIGGKNLFIASLEQALVAGDADIAVHSLKDMAAVLEPSFILPAVLPRADVRDVYCHAKHTKLSQLPPGAVIGTASPRRECLLKHFYPQLEIKCVRGNVPTRLAKLQAGDYDAIILAAAGLLRLQLQQHISDYLDPKLYIPAIAQGAIAVECLASRADIQELLAPLDDPLSRRLTTIERGVNAKLGGSCQHAIAAHCYVHPDGLMLQAMVGASDGTLLRASATAADDDQSLVDTVVAQLVEMGAEQYLS